MSDENNNRWFKLGAIKKGRTGNSYIALGTVKSKFEPYNVEVIVTDLKGNVLTKVMNPNLNVQNPRKRPGATPEQIAKIPEYLLAELSLPPPKKV